MIKVGSGRAFEQVCWNSNFHPEWLEINEGEEPLERSDLNCKWVGLEDMSRNQRQVGLREKYLVTGLDVLRQWPRNSHLLREPNKNCVRRHVRPCVKIRRSQHGFWVVIRMEHASGVSIERTRCCLVDSVPFSVQPSVCRF